MRVVGAIAVASWVPPRPTALVEGAVGWLEIVYGIGILRKKLLNRWMGSVNLDAVCSHRSLLDLFLNSRMM